MNFINTGLFTRRDWHTRAGTSLAGTSSCSAKVSPASRRLGSIYNGRKCVLILTWRCGFNYFLGYSYRLSESLWRYESKLLYSLATWLWMFISSETFVSCHPADCWPRSRWLLHRQVFVYLVSFVARDTCVFLSNLPDHYCNYIGAIQTNYRHLRWSDLLMWKVNMETRSVPMPLWRDDKFTMLIEQRAMSKILSPLEFPR